MKGVNKRCNYVMVMDWMYDNFDLNVAEANALGIVYGFCQDGESWYRGGSSYIAARLHISQKSAKNYLNDFTKRGILTMKKIMVGNVECNAYQTVPGIETLVLRKGADPGKNLPGENFSPVKNFPSDPGKIFPQTREKFSHKKEIENTSKKYTPSRARSDGGETRTPLDVFSAWCSGAVPEQEQPRLMEQLKRFDAYRAARRGKAWDAQAAQAVCDKLTQLADEAKTAQRTDYMVASIRQSIEAGWSVLDHPKSWGHAAGQRAKPSSLRVERSPEEIEAAGDWMRTAPLRRPLIRQQKAGAGSD